MKYYLPEGIDLPETIRNYNPKYLEKYLWMLHSIGYNSVNSKNTSYGYVNLNKQLLRAYIGSDYTDKIINDLRESNIIEVNKCYKVGQYSMSYRLTEPYRSSWIERVQFDSPKTQGYEKKLQTYRNDSLAKYIPNLVYKQIYENVCALTVDYDDAFAFCCREFSSGGLSDAQFNSYVIPYRQIMDRYINFTVGPDCGRVYHNITNFPSKLRKHLRYNGESLWQIDIRNSQPVLFNKLLQDYFRQKGETTSTTSIPTTSVLTNPLLPYVDWYLPTDVALYQKLTQEGKFYEYLMEQFSIPLENRDAFKGDFFGTIFYSKVNHGWSHKFAKEFQKLFPNVYEAILWLKREDHRDLPIMLQKTESEVVIEEICGRIVYENPPETRPYFCTIHDSIVCLEKDVPYLTGIMKDELTRLLNFIPTLKVSKL